MKIIFGGSFDPVHNGHLRIATELSELFRGHPVELVPCKVPVHKDGLAVSPEQRLQILQSAVEDNPVLLVNSCELDREGVSDSYTTLVNLVDEGLGPVVMAVGTDSALGLGSWYRASELSGLCHLVVLKRPDYEEGPLKLELAALGFELVSDPSLFEICAFGKAFLFDVTQLQISSSDIRRRIAQNMTIKYLVPDAVQRIICNNRFYS